MNFTEFLMYTIAFPAAVLLFAIGGILLLVFGGSEDKRVLGKKMLTNTLIGLLIVMLAWLGVDTIIKVLTLGRNAFISDGGIGPWNRLDPSDCPLSRGLSTGPSVGGLTTGAPAATPAPGVVAGRQTCEGCANLSVPQKPGACAGTAQGQTCQVNSALNQKLVKLNRRIIEGGRLNFWRVTEAWPPTRPHQNSCHQSATCVDAGFAGGAGGATPRNINYFIQTAQGEGVRPVWEVTTAVRKEELVRSGVPAANIQVVAGVSGEHFSIYQ